MANLTFDYRSRVRGKETKFNVILPENADVFSECQFHEQYLPYFLSSGL